MDSTIIQISVTQKCLKCGREFSFTINPDITSTMDRYIAGELTAFCHVKPNNNDNCIKECCPHCQTFYALDIGAMELHCYME